MLQEIMDKNVQTLNSIDFAMSVNKALGDISIFIPIDTIMQSYSDIAHIVQPDSQADNFISKGLHYMEISKKKQHTTNPLSAFAAHRLTEICQQLDIATPSWVPRVHKVEVHNSIHQYSYFFDWSTVKAAQIPNKYTNYFEGKLRGNIKEREQQPTNIRNSAIADQLQGLEIQTVPFDESMVQQEETQQLNVDFTEASGESTGVIAGHIETSDLQANAKHGLFVASTYISLSQAATEANVIFNLDIEQLSTLLKTNVCHFTDEKLVLEHINGSPRILAPNHIVVARKDEQGGYEIDNLIISSHQFIELRKTMTPEQFKQTAEAKKLMVKAGISPEQMALMASITPSIVQTA